MVCREKWVQHYSSFHQILVVGDGDFSFSLSLASSFGSALNITATSLDSYETLTEKYRKAKSNLEALQKLGASIIHGVDATKMKLHGDLNSRRFDRIIYNFPHAGFHGKEDSLRIIRKHRRLVNGFFHNARGMLRPNGEVHVSHKTAAPFCDWNLEKLASENTLMLIESVPFRISDYPGYINKRGDGSRSDKPFPLGECSTFKFMFARRSYTSRRSSRHVGDRRYLATKERDGFMEEYRVTYGLCIRTFCSNKHYGYRVMPMHMNHGTRKGESSRHEQAKKQQGDQHEHLRTRGWVRCQDVIMRPRHKHVDIRRYLQKDKIRPMVTYQG